MSREVTEAMKPLHALMRDGQFDLNKIDALLKSLAGLISVLVDKEPDELRRMVLQARFDEALLHAVHQNEINRRMKDAA